MAIIQETAYPKIKNYYSAKELEKYYTLTSLEIDFVEENARSPLNRLGIATLLKSIQHLGYFEQTQNFPKTIIDYIIMQLGILAKQDLSIYDKASIRRQHLQKIRELLHIKPVGDATYDSIEQTAKEAAKTKNEAKDIINVVLEILVKEKFEFPSFSRIDRIVRRVKNEVNQSIINDINHQLPDEYKEILDFLLTTPDDRQTSLWDEIKREPGKPTSTKIRSYVEHMTWLMEIHPKLRLEEIISAPKKRLMYLEALSLDAGLLSKLLPKRRHALMTVFIDQQSGYILDDIAKMFLKLMQKLTFKSKEALEEYQLKHQERADQLIEKLRDILLAYASEGTRLKRFGEIAEVIEPNTKQIQKKCEEHLTYAFSNYYQFLLPLYKKKRSVLFKCIDVLPLKATSNDNAIINCLDFIKENRKTKREWIEIPEFLDIKWLPEKARKLVTNKVSKNAQVEEVHLKYFEICVFQELMNGLKSLNIYVEGSLELADYRSQLISLDQFEEQKDDYCQMMSFSTNPTEFANNLEDWLLQKVTQTDESFSSNEYVKIREGEISIQKIKKNPLPNNIHLIDEQLRSKMKPIGILDVITSTEKSLNLSNGFQTLSGDKTRIANHQERFITSLFCYGCNLGPTQTARALDGVNRRQVTWINTHQVTEDRLDKAISRTINYFNQYALPKYWGTGKTSSADGTKWELYEQNLLSEYHIRYGGYGGIGYYHVSDTYIALFSHFIPCGVYEAVYILDGLLKNESDIQPDIIHGDTQSQTEPIFGLAYLLGIKLMPRIRNLKRLRLYKPNNFQKFDHIGGLFSGTINWDIIKTHLDDMLRVAVSIKNGKVNASTILRRLGTQNKQNKLYIAFRELGRVIRTGFLLDYFRDVDLRKMIQAATNKSEEYNGFTKWIAFGNHGKITTNMRHEQSKMIKYNQLIANLIILYNVNEMSKAIDELASDGMPIDKNILKALSPYRTDHINRFGKYTIDTNIESLLMYEKGDLI